MGRIYLNGVGYAGGGTSDYTSLYNQPQINDVTVTGDLSLADLGISTLYYQTSEPSSPSAGDVWIGE